MLAKCNDCYGVSAAPVGLESNLGALGACTAGSRHVGYQEPALGLPVPSREHWNETSGCLPTPSMFPQQYESQGCTVAPPAPSALLPSEGPAQE